MQNFTRGSVVADNARAEIARRRLRQAVIAERLGMTQQSLSRRLTGVVPFSVDELTALAGLLGVQPAALLDDPTADEVPA